MFYKSRERPAPTTVTTLEPAPTKTAEAPGSLTGGSVTPNGHLNEPEPGKVDRATLRSQEAGVAKRDRKRFFRFFIPRDVSARPSSPDGPTVSLRSLSSKERKNIRRAYKQSTYYHGTNLASKRAIQSAGFDLRRKEAGATATALGHPALAAMLDDSEKFRATAASHHFLTQNKKMAKEYAGFKKTGRRALVRVSALASPHTAPQPFAFEEDPDADDDPQAVRTRDSIPSGYILQSKKGGDQSQIADAHKTFQEALLRTGLDVSVDQARRWHSEVQSDSEDDF